MFGYLTAVIGFVALAVTVASTSLAAGNAPAKPLLLVLCKADNEVAIVDPDSMTVTAKLPTGVGPHEVAVSPDAKTAYVANYGDVRTPGNTLTVVDLVDQKVSRTVDLGVLRRPHGLAVAQDGRVWFTAELNAVVGRYDPAADKVDAIIGTGQALSHMVARDPITGKLYTANIVANSVTAIDPRGPHPKPRHIAAHDGPEGIAISPDGKTLWVGHVKSGDIVVIDTTTSEVTDTIGTDGGVPIRLAFTPDGKRVLASDARNGALLVYDAATKKQLARIEVGNTPVGVTISQDGKRAYVATTGDGHVSCIELETLKATNPVEVGEQPDGIAWAQPVDPAMRAAAAARKPGALGVALAEAPDNAGVVIAQVNSDSAASAAGLREGDVLVAVDGTNVESAEQFVDFVSARFAGDELKLDVVRDGKSVSVTAKLTEKQRS